MFNKKKENLNIPAHVAIILDGNGRWAKKRGMPRTYGHQKGVENIRRVALAASDFGIKALSVYAFSTENWKRPKAEVDFLMKLPGEFEKKFKDDFEKHDIKVTFSGRKTHLSKENLEILERITEKTSQRQGLVLNICFDYGSQTEITEAVKNSKTRSKWSEGVKLYALELLEKLGENIDYRMNEDAGDVWGEISSPALLEKELLNGAEHWKEYSEGGCSLVYDFEIAQRTCTPSELKRTKNGELNPNSRENWLDVQARALFQAANLIKRLCQ